MDQHRQNRFPKFPSQPGVVWRSWCIKAAALWAVCAILVACTTITDETPVPATVDPGPFYTQAAQTMAAADTLAVAQLTANAPVFTPNPTASLTQLPPTFTPEATDSPALSTETPTTEPTQTRPPAPTRVIAPCNQAEFLRDLSSTTSNVAFPDEPFVKTWLIANTGSCTWNPGYSALFVSGSPMSNSTGNQDAFAFTNIVLPGESTAVNLILTAPANPGIHRSAWLLSSDQGELFGFGPNRDEPAWVEIEVEAPPASYYYDFANSYCSATWENEFGLLPCPGDVSSQDGFVLRLESANLESHLEDEPLIWTQPSEFNNSWIRGIFPAIRIENGDRFLADIGCLAGNPDCDVVFQLNYRIPGGVTNNLGEWREDYDGRITRVNIDLSSLAGRSVELILTTLANGPSDDDAAFWLNPHIQTR